MFTTLAQLRSWVEMDWLYAIRTQEAHEHLRPKLSEEIEELIEELLMGDPERVVLEGGDVNWCAIANVINAERDGLRLINWDGLMHGEGLTYLLDIDMWAWDLGHPWYSPQELQLSRYDIALTSCEQVTASIRSANVPVISAVLRALADELGYASNKTRYRADFYGTEYGLRDYPDRTLHSLLQLLLLVSLITQMWTGVGLAETMERTKTKHEERAAAGKPVTSPATKSRTTDGT